MMIFLSGNSSELAEHLKHLKEERRSLGIVKLLDTRVERKRFFLHHDRLKISCNYIYY
jgi:hypothetical protein